MSENQEIVIYEGTGKLYYALLWPSGRSSTVFNAKNWSQADAPRGSLEIPWTAEG